MNQEESSTQGRDRSSKQTPARNRASSLSLGAGILSVLLLILPFWWNYYYWCVIDWHEPINYFFSSLFIFYPWCVIAGNIAILGGIVSLLTIKTYGRAGIGYALAGVVLGIVSICTAAILFLDGLSGELTNFYHC